MNLIVFKNLVKIFLFALVLWTFIFGTFFVDMDVNMKDGKANCFFGGHSAAICQMNPMEHIEEWQSMFTMLPSQDIFLTLFLLFALFVISKLRSWNRFSIQEPPLLFTRNYSIFLNSLRIFDPLKEAFSSGILNPKSF